MSNLIYDDDYIQGIMFSRSEKLDLPKMSLAERQAYKMITNINTQRDWSTWKRDSANRARRPRAAIIKSRSYLQAAE